MKKGDLPYKSIKSLRNDPQLFARFGNHINGSFNLARFVRGGDGGAQPRQTFWHGGRNDRQDKYIVMLGFTRHGKSLIIRTAYYRHNRGRGQQSIEACRFSPLMNSCEL